jgi:Family of unknown function (DUF5675)
MKLLLQRQAPINGFTPGELFVDGVFVCHTVEDLVREEKIPGQTAIPSGVYEIIINMSARFKRMLPLLLNVPNFSGVRIHPGNTEFDTEGCILPGLNTTATGVGNSVKAMEKLQPMIQAAKDRGERVIIEVRNA